MRRSGTRILFVGWGVVLGLSAGALLYAGSLYLSAGALVVATFSPTTVVPETSQTGASLSGFPQSKDGPRRTTLPPAVCAIGKQPASSTVGGTPEARNGDASPSTDAIHDAPPGRAVDTPAPTYDYDLIAATEEERRAADEVAKQLRAEDADILAKAQSGELAQEDVKPALERRMRTETESLTRIFGADRTARLLEAQNKPGG